MDPRRARLCIWLVSIFSLASAALAGVKVIDARFQLVELNGGDDEWYEIAVELDVRGDAQDATSRDSRFLEGVSVEVEIACEARRTSGRAFEFYRSSVAFVALEEGRRIARFYLPPEIVKRDDLRGPPFSFRIEARQGDATLDLRASSNLATEIARRSFADRLASAGPRNGGILRPQWQTPFDALYPSSTPTSLRKAD